MTIHFPLFLLYKAQGFLFCFYHFLPSISSFSFQFSLNYCWWPPKMQRLSQVILGRWSLIESNNSGSLPRRLRFQHIYILEQNSSHAISNLQYVYSFMVSLKDFHILWVVYYIQQTTNWPWYKKNKWCHYCVLLRLFGIKALANTDSQLWLRMGRVLWVGEHVCDQVHVI